MPLDGAVSPKIILKVFKFGSCTATLWLCAYTAETFLFLSFLLSDMAHVHINVPHVCVDTFPEQ